MTSGIDPGAAWTKIAGVSGKAARFPTPRGPEAAAAAVRARTAGADDVVVATSRPADESLADTLGAQAVPSAECLAAGLSCSGPPRSVVLVDAGARDLRVCLVETGEGRVRLLNRRVVPDAGHEASAELMRRAGVHDEEGFEAERVRSARRARLVLDHAAEDDRYLDTPIHLSGHHGRAVTAADHIAATRPLHRAAAQAVRDLVRSAPDTAELAEAELAVVGGYADAGLVAAVADAWGD
jgi:hypothetical protein